MPKPIVLRYQISRIFPSKVKQLSAYFKSASPVKEMIFELKFDIPIYPLIEIDSI